MRHFLQLLAEKLIKMPKFSCLLEKLLGLTKSIIFHAFLRNERLFATFGRKVDENAEKCQLARKVATFGKVDDFSCFFTK